MFALWLLILFGLTGASALYLRLSHIALTDFSPVIILIAYTPSLAAFFAVGFSVGLKGIKQLVRQILIWKMSPWWYVAVLIVPFLIIFAANILNILLGGQAPDQWITIPTISAIGPIIAGAFGEEFGWRGFAQPYLQKYMNVLWASVLVGFLWATWHVWPVLLPGGMGPNALLDCLQTYIRLIGTAVLYGWLYNRTRGSLLIVMLAHAGHNIAVDFFTISEQTSLIIACLYFLLALFVVLFTKKASLTHKQNTVALHY